MRKGLKVKPEEFLAGRDAVLVFKCAECGKIDTVEGYEDVHSETGSQLAHETQKLYCYECEDID